MKLEVTVCNVCADVSRPTQSYTVASGGRTGEADLCDEHAVPLEAVLDTSAKPKPAKPAPTRRRNSTPMMTMDEIERAKRK